MTDIVVALGGGGMKGVAHLGVLECLSKAGYNIKAVAGTSAGGIIGALYASGAKTEDIQRALNKMSDRKFFSRLPDDGPSLLGLRGFLEILDEFIGERTFDDLLIPFAATSVDLVTNLEVIINSGKVADAVLSTMSIPGVFPPRKIGKFELVDGGVLDPVPVSVARWLNPGVPVVAVCLHPAPDKWASIPDMRTPPELPVPVPYPIIEQLEKIRVGQALKIYNKAMDIQTRMTGELRMQIEKPDVLIRPSVEHVGILDHVNPEELFNEGYRATEAQLDALKKSINWQNSFFRKFQKADAPGQLLQSGD